MGAEHRSPAPIPAGRHPMATWERVGGWQCHLLARQDLLELNTLQRAEGCSGNPEAAVQEQCGGLGIVVAAAWGLPSVNQFVNQLAFLSPSPQHGVAGSSGTDLGPVAFCAGPSFAGRRKNLPVGSFPLSRHFIFLKRLCITVH